MKPIWDQVSAELKNKILPGEYERYIKPMVFNQKHSKPDLVVYNVSNEIIARFIYTKYAKIIEMTYEQITGVKPIIIITSKTKITAEKKSKTENKPQSSLLNNFFSFENFVVGDSNRFAYTCSQHVAQNPGLQYNPLFIYGSSGLGKTHLLQSIGNYCIKNKKSVILASSEQFINDFTFHLNQKTMDRFTNKYRNCDVLLIDDVQFLGKTDKIQDAFFHTFNELTDKNSQIVMTSDKPPKALKGFEERLLSRFESGLLADIVPPELDTKIAIIRKKSQDNKINLSQDIIEYIATNMGDNIREIESVIIRLNAFSTLMRTEITLKFTKDIMQDQIKEKTDSINIEKIIEVVSKELNIKPSDLRSKSRKKKIVEARRIAIYLSKQLTLNSMPAIASHFDLKDHSAISHNIRRISEIIKNDKLLKVKIDELENRIKSKKSE